MDGISWHRIEVKRDSVNCWKLLWSKNFGDRDTHHYHNSYIVNLELMWNMNPWNAKNWSIACEIGKIMWKEWLEIHDKELKRNMIPWNDENRFHVKLLKLREKSVNENSLHWTEMKHDSIKCWKLISREIAEITWIECKWEFDE